MVESNLSPAIARRDDESVALSLFLITCQIIFAISVVGKSLVLISKAGSADFAKPDFILGIAQTKVMAIASLLELTVIVMLGSKAVRTPKKLGLLLAIASSFITYHVWAWVTGVPTCPCMGNLIPKEASAKVSFLAAVLLFVGSGMLLYKRPDRASSDAPALLGGGGPD